MRSGEVTGGWSKTFLWERVWYDKNYNGAVKLDIPRVENWFQVLAHSNLA